MKFEFKTWSLSKLITLYDNGKLNLNPPYQRNDIWALKQQKYLLDTIEKGMPFPNFFLYKQNGKYEMVDGQQRSRTIIGFAKDKLPDAENRPFSTLTASEKRHFKSYKIAVSIITDLSSNETMENYYVLVNSTGARLNRPELIKAEYFETPFLKAIQNLSENPGWKELDIFTEKSKDRMNDVDFIGEILALIEFGPTEKKEKVDSLLKTPPSAEQIQHLVGRFISTLEVMKTLNKDVSIKTTRFRQKNDFYTLFQFVHNNLDIFDVDIFKYYYRLILKIAPHISPSLEECEPLMNYALNCVSQSNSKSARDFRYEFFVNLFLNPSPVPNPVQSQVIIFLKPSQTTKETLKKVGNYFTLDVEALSLS